jgi:hypothetical protein
LIIAAVSGVLYGQIKITNHQLPTSGSCRIAGSTPVTRSRKNALHKGNVFLKGRRGEGERGRMGEHAAGSSPVVCYRI